MDEDTFMKMVERQYEIVKKERSKSQEDPKKAVPNGTVEPTNSFAQQNGQNEVRKD